MRTDVKYGVIIAVCVILLLGAWWVVVRNGDGKPADHVATTGGGDGATQVPVIPADEPIIPPASEDTAPAPEPAAGPGMISVDYGSDLPAGDVAPATPPATEPPSPATDLDVELAGHDPLASAPPPGAPEAATARLPGAGTITPAYTDPLEPSLPAVAGAGKTYKVRQRDTYWDIAVREYGDGKLASLIQQANPKVGPKDLKPDMTIRIPPKPAPTLAAGTAAAAHGTLKRDPLTGKQFYIVKDGDRGFWDISKAVFSDGKHYVAIQKANPDIDPRRLHAGDKVWIPSVPKTPAAPVTVAAKAPTRSTRTASHRPPTMTATVHIKTGAPTRQKLPDGTWFD